MRGFPRNICAIAVLALTTCFAPKAWADDIGQIKNASGQVSLVRKAAPQGAKAGDLIQQGDVLITGANGSTGITFIDNSRLSIGPNSRVEISQFRYDSTTQEGEFLAEVQRGTLVIVSGHLAKQPGEAMKVKTPTALITVRGTTFAVKVED